MIETEQQRRWWFATHPEYSGGRSGQRSQGQDAKAEAYQSLEEFLEMLRRIDLPLEPDPHTFLDVMPFRRLVTSPIGFVKDLFRNQAKDVILNAAKKGGTDGPGKWVDVGRRGGPSLEHQSRMSGHPILKNGDQHRINEYRLNGVDFDDYRNGKLYEYKGRLEHLFDKNNDIKPWVEKPGQFRDEALRQVKAAQGIPVIWKVGANQVMAFKKALGDIPGLSLEP